MKILLLQPPNQKGKGWGYYWLPSNIAGLASVLEENGYRSQVKIVDLLWNYDFHGVRELLEEHVPDVVGITCVTNIRMNAFRLARMVRSACPNAAIIMGGMYITNMYEQVLMNQEVDIAVIGEGEATLLDLVRSLETGTPVEEVEGIALRREDRVIRTPPRPFIQDLDSLPLPAYHLLDLKSMENYRDTDFVYDLVLSRGCPFQCLFCSTRTQWGSSYRSFGVKKVGDLIEHLLSSFQTDFIVLNDDTFSLKEERIVGICQEILNRGLKFEWYARTRVDLISRESLVWMKKAGCKVVSYGVESGSPRILKNINKKTHLKDIVNTFKMTREVGIITDATIMVGNPGEDASTVKETERLLEEIRPGNLDVGLPILWPGTGLYELAKKQNLIDDDYWLTDLLAPIYVGAMSLPRMWFYKWRMLFRHSLRQKTVLNFLKLLRRELTLFRLMAAFRIAYFNVLKRVKPPASDQGAGR